ncbi:MAG: DUF2723 domain-containing protein [candidate division Zixibacteria bacterium]|nr:DUF2723 domain-containing protein [candidate division Zixibacteria bacterium]
MVKHDIDYSYFRPTKMRLISDWAPPFIVFIGAFGLYIKTMALSPLWGNYTAYLTGSMVFGPNSPTTSPLYSFLISIISLIPGLSQAFLSNLFSAFFSSLSVLMFYMIVKKLSDIHVFKKNIKELPGYQKLAETNPNLEQIGQPINIKAISGATLTVIPSLAVTALYAITLPVWLTAVHAGVYSLFLALTMGAIYFAIEGCRTDKIKYFLLGIWLFALTFTCQPIVSLALVPAFLYLVARQYSITSFKPAVLISVLIFLVVSFSAYFYLPIHSTLETIQNSAVDGSQEGFLESLSIFSSSEMIPKNDFPGEYFIRFKKIVAFIAGEISWFSIALVLIGLWGTYKASKRIFPFFPLAIIGSLGWLIWFGRFEMQNYEMVGYPAIILGLILMVVTVGLQYLIRLKLQAGTSSAYVALCFLPLIYAAFDSNYKIANKSEFNAPKYISEQILKGVPDGSLVIVEDENLLQPLMYYVSQESNKAKVSVLSSEAMGNADYRKQVIDIYPWLTYPIGFETISNNEIDNQIYNLCRLNSPARGIYVQFGIDGLVSKDLKPSGVMFEFAPDYKQRKKDIYDYRFHLKMAEKIISSDYNDPTAIKILGQWLYNAGVYFERRGNRVTAWKLYDRALTVDQGSTEIRVLLADGLANEGSYKKALKLISDALKINSDDPSIMELGRRLENELKNRGEMAVSD